MAELHTHTHTHTESYMHTSHGDTQEEIDMLTDAHKTTFIIILPISAGNFRAALLLLLGFLDRAIKEVYWQFSWQSDGLF